MKPLFIWAGGKSRLIRKQYKPHLPTGFDVYIEPFFGGGAMFCWAYLQNPQAKFVLNDRNESLMQVYGCVRDALPEFKARLDALSQEYLPLGHAARKEFYYRIRHAHAWDYESWSKPFEAATQYFLLRTGFNGLWQINQNTNGRFGTPAGLLNHGTQVYDAENLEAWHEALQGATLSAQSYSRVLTRNVRRGTFVFMDPPYRGGFTKYGVDFDDDRQRQVLEAFERCGTQGAYVMLSNRDLGDGFFDAYDPVRFEVTYTAGRRKKNKDGTFEAKPATEVLLKAGNRVWNP